MYNDLHVMNVRHTDQDGEKYTVAYCRDYPGGGWKNFRQLYRGEYGAAELMSENPPAPIACFGLNPNPYTDGSISFEDAHRILYESERQ